MVSINKEGNFRRFEQILKVACDRYPEPTALKLDGISTSTARIKVRECIRDYILFNYPSVLNREKMIEIDHSWTVADDDGTLYIGPRRSKTSRRPSFIQDEGFHLGREKQIAEPVDCSNPAIAVALCELKNLDIILGHIEITSLDPLNKQKLAEAFPNIAFHTQDGQTFIL